MNREDLDEQKNLRVLMSKDEEEVWESLTFAFIHHKRMVRQRLKVETWEEGYVVYENLAIRSAVELRECFVAAHKLCQENEK